MNRRPILPPLLVSLVIYAAYSAGRLTAPISKNQQQIADKALFLDCSHTVDAATKATEPVIADYKVVAPVASDPPPYAPLQNLDPCNATEWFPMAPADVTIVTAYFRANAKHSNQDYDVWMTNMLAIQDNMIIFTSLDLVGYIQEKRQHAKTHIVTTTLDKTWMVEQYGWDFWNKEQHKRDPEKKFHSGSLYVIWDEKSSWLLQGVQLNPFQSAFFAWVDIGYFREARFNGKRMIRQLPQTFQAYSVMMLDLHTIEKHTVGGGFIGGYAAGIRKWVPLWYSTLNQFSKTEFIGKDQTWMRRTCDVHQDENLCYLVQTKTGLGQPYNFVDEWFYMAPFLSGDYCSV
jgi:Bacterial protein of unknown function (HtrL_YibB)